ncbi:MAG TPA: DUF2283 domain-containing protein [Bacteroidota bacterium]|nr:DUF2283 domain-containing protein [Bacteroidota bacterium]
MKFEYDQERNLLYLGFRENHPRVAKTVTITPGVHADFDSRGKLLGIEVLEASSLLGKKIEIELPRLRTSKRAV